MYIRNEQKLLRCTVIYSCYLVQTKKKIIISINQVYIHRVLRLYSRIVSKHLDSVSAIKTFGWADSNHKGVIYQTKRLSIKKVLTFPVFIYFPDKEGERKNCSNRFTCYNNYRFISKKKKNKYKNAVIKVNTLPPTHCVRSSKASLYIRELQIGWSSCPSLFTFYLIFQHCSFYITQYTQLPKNSSLM